MADDVTDPEDFSALWGAQDLSALWGAQADGDVPPGLSVAPAPEPAPEQKDSDDAGHSNGMGDGGPVTVVDQGVRDGVARLAQAIAVNQVDVVRKGDLEALRTELEGTFAHQLAVALYEVLAASNDRFAAAEGRIIERLNDSVDAHGLRLGSMEERQVLSLEAVEAVRSELGELRNRLNGPIDALVSFQRDMRHEVARLGDMVATEGATIARTADAELAELASARRELTDRMARSDAQSEEAAGELNGVSQTLTTVKDDVSALREEIAELREALGRKARSHWWSRSGQ